jgi:TonB-linked SusC/RagA family outer membrane protein
MLKYIIIICCLLKAIVPACAQEQANIKSNVKMVDTVSILKNTLNRIVPIAYGSQKQRNITSSISTVYSDKLSNTSVTMLSNSLFGLLPGLVVKENAGEVGFYSNDLYVRGQSSFGNSNAPLVLIDGFERNSNDITQDDIESVSVLKDAAATAMYGVRGANGVILITSKRGREGKMKIVAALETGLSTPTRMPSFVNSATYAQMYNTALSNDGLPLRYTSADIEGYQAGNSIYYPDNQWEKTLIRKTSPYKDFNVSASGGDKSTKYYASLGYLGNEGIFNNTNFNDKYSTNSLLDKFNFRTNLDIKAFTNLDIRLDISGQVNRRNLPRNSTTDIVNSLYQYPQNEFPEFINGTLGGTSAFLQNPEGFLNRSGYRKLHDEYYQTGLSTQYNFQNAFKGLVAGARFAYDNANAITETYSRSFAVSEITGINADQTPILTVRGADGQLSYSNGSNAQARHTSVEGFIDYDRTFANLHNLKALFMYHQDRLMTDESSPVNNQFYSGRLNYAYKNKYLAEVILSYSGSEAFAPSNRFNLFPAASLGWILTEEKFMKKFTQVDFLKLRMSAGIVGNSMVGSRFAYREQYSNNGSYNFGTNIQTNYGISESTLANPNMSPEKALKIDIGMDAMFFNSLSVNAGYFFQRRYNILTSLGNITSSVFGAPLPSVNAGVVYNQGVELALNYKKTINKSLGGLLGFNMLYYTNKINQINEQPLPANSAYQYQKGGNLGQVLGLKSIGFFKDQQDINNSPVQQYGPVKPGDIKYADTNNDGVINDFDRTYLSGYAVPNVDLGFTAGFRYKSFDVSGVLNAQLGTNIYLGDAPSLFWPLSNSNYRISDYVGAKTPWTVQNAEIANYPRLTTLQNDNNYRRSDFWTVNGNLLRVRKLEIGYTLPEFLSSKIAMNTFRLYIRGMNMFTFNKLGFVDPVALDNNPLMKLYTLGLTANFK